MSLQYWISYVCETDRLWFLIRAHSNPRFHPLYLLIQCILCFVIALQSEVKYRLPRQPSQSNIRWGLLQSEERLSQNTIVSTARLTSKSYNNHVDICMECWCKGVLHSHSLNQLLVFLPLGAGVLNSLLRGLMERGPAGKRHSAPWRELWPRKPCDPESCLPPPFHVQPHYCPCWQLLPVLCAQCDECWNGSTWNHFNSCLLAMNH